MRRSELVRALARVPSFPHPDPSREQLATPPELAADLLWDALQAGDIAGRSVLDLGCGTGRLAIGAAILGADPVTGVDADAEAIELGRRAAREAGVGVAWEVRPVGAGEGPVDTVVMNPPFGAQRAHADRPFWEEALRRGRRVHAFALAASRTFIAREAVARRGRIDATRPVDWRLPATFPHHRRRAVTLAVDRWIVSGPRQR
ncbi:MAG TPA: METTL5 family protein [Thermoplasmata archaeon]|nr:METTL5 family protein [Thermoplasmata archaeon]